MGEFLVAQPNKIQLMHLVFTHAMGLRYIASLSLSARAWHQSISNQLELSMGQVEVGGPPSHANNISVRTECLRPAVHRTIKTRSIGFHNSTESQVWHLMQNYNFPNKGLYSFIHSSMEYLTLVMWHIQAWNTMLIQCLHMQNAMQKSHKTAHNH